MTADECLQEICRRAWRLGVAVRISPDETVLMDGSAVSGYFEDEGPAPLLVCATGADPDKWLGTLLHEFSHACQWAEQATIWQSAKSCNQLWEWLDGKPIKDIATKVAAVRDLEADCERRTARLILEMGAPVDLARYCRAANAYVHFYNTVATERKWYAPMKGPYSYEPVLTLCHETIDRDFSKPPPKLAKALLGCV